MPADFEVAFARVKQLAAEFKANEGFYLSPQYQEAEARRDFIDKFLIALGWDVNHDKQKNPCEQEVKVERKEQGASQRRADYAFYLAPNFKDVKFYIEAKKPFADLATTDNYFQTIRYGWNSQTPVGVLFDFERLEIVDCRFKPNLDTALQRNLKQFHYSEYSDEEEFANIYWLFSREAVASGSLEKYAETLPKKHGAVQRGLLKGGCQSIDEAFLEELDKHRDTLARIFKNWNSKLYSETLTEVTQRTLDRLVFMRFLEDKLIEPEYLVANFGQRGSAWHEFIATSERLNGIYNGIVFKKNAVLDSENFTVDDDQFSRVCEALCHINSPYDFNAIPIHILGSIYERFLGKVIVATDKRARVEEKPEVRKAGGVDYTPEYIVHYIVENTIGKLVEGKTPAQIAEMRFADIACGSGSFLLGVYDRLIRHHTRFYNDNPGKAKKGDVVERDDGLHLSLQKKREILLNNIYGVDIDPQAVEVAQLSLYLKLLQDETPGSARNYQLEFHETLLPSLNKNIVCGNSLIGTDILTGQLFASDEEKKLNPMDFEQRFPHIFSRGQDNESGSLRETERPLDFSFPGVPLHGSYSDKKKKGVGLAPPAAPEFEGGFDAIIGNPPYRMLQPHNTDAGTLSYLRGHYVATDFKIELFHLFLQRAVSLVKTGGFQSYIVPTTVLNNVYAGSLRKWLLKKCCVEQICVARGRVFAHADVHTSVMVYRLEPDPGKREQHFIQTTAELGQEFVASPRFSGKTKQITFSELPGCVWNILVNEHNKSLISRLTNDFPALKNLAAIKRGLITGDRDKYFADTKKTKDHVRIIAGSDVQRYFVAKPGEFVLFKRPKTAGGCWDSDVHFAPHKLVVRQICERPTAGILRSPVAVTGNIFTVRGSSLENELYLLGIINSRLTAFFWKTMFADFKESFPQVTIFSLEQLPICHLDLSNPAGKAKHRRMVQLVEQMLTAKKQLAGAQIDRDKEFYANRCDGLDRQIDAIVYEAYGLNAQEIRLVEGANA
ncbi:MAG: Eco57I restriction-modification methylase domain-containing protein [Limisphaerales bacterium]